MFGIDGKMDALRLAASSIISLSLIFGEIIIVLLCQRNIYGLSLMGLDQPHRDDDTKGGSRFRSPVHKYVLANLHFP